MQECWVFCDNLVDFFAHTLAKSDNGEPKMTCIFFFFSSSELDTANCMNIARDVLLLFLYAGLNVDHLDIHLWIFIQHDTVLLYI